MNPTSDKAVPGSAIALPIRFRTLWYVLEEMDQVWIPVYRDYRLNERSYGALQGLNKAETAAKFGADQVHI